MAFCRRFESLEKELEFLGFKQQQISHDGRGMWTSLDLPCFSVQKSCMHGKIYATVGNGLVYKKTFLFFIKTQSQNISNHLVKVGFEKVPEFEIHKGGATLI